MRPRPTPQAEPITAILREGGGTTSTYPFERWRYRYIEGIGNDIILEFVDKCMCNEYRLTLDPSEKDALLNTPGAGLTLSEQQGLDEQGRPHDGRRIRRHWPVG